jgi:hypothetical protein
MDKKTKKTKQNENEKAAAELVRDPLFLFKVVQQVGAAGVIGEEANRLILFLACLTAALTKVVSVLVKGPTSTGKNNLTKAVLSLIPPDRVLTRSSFSPKALVYSADDFAGKILYLVEHRGGRDAQFFTRLLQSEGELHHEVTKASSSRTDVLTHAGAPVFISTTTDDRVYEDDETRFLSIRADESSELTRDVLRAMFKENQEGGN